MTERRSRRCCTGPSIRRAPERIGFGGTRTLSGDMSDRDWLRRTPAGSRVIGIVACPTPPATYGQPEPAPFEQISDNDRPAQTPPYLPHLRLRRDGTSCDHDHECSGRA